MGTESKYFAQIPDYLEDLLSREEKEAFERELETDNALMQEVDLHREVVSSLRNNDQRRFREKLERFNREIPVEAPEGKKSTKFFSLKILISIAASLLLLIALTTWVLQSGPSAREQVTAYLDNYDPADILPPAYIAPDRNGNRDLDGERSQDATPSPLNREDPLYEARQFFSQKQYPEALAVMETIDPGSLADRDAFFYELGMLNLLNDQPGSAIEAFEKMERPALQNAKYWHLALAYLKLDRIEDAKKLLQQLDQKSPSGLWQKRARQLIQGL